MPASDSRHAVMMMKGLSHALKIHPDQQVSQHN